MEAEGLHSMSGEPGSTQVKAGSSALPSRPVRKPWSDLFSREHKLDGVSDTGRRRHANLDAILRSIC
jgi:hypothetical protein